jgi:hypothetical protein
MKRKLLYILYMVVGVFVSKLYPPDWVPAWGEQVGFNFLAGTAVILLCYLIDEMVERLFFRNSRIR